MDRGCPDPGWRRPDQWPRHRRPIDARARARFFRGMVATLIAALVLGAASFVVAVWLIADRAGMQSGPATPAALALAVLAVVFFVVSRAVQRGVRPMRAVMDAADRVAGGDYGVRVAEHGSPPVQALARSFNAMTERLQHADRLRRDLMADVAHELRTPLSVLQGRLEGLLDGVYPRDDRELQALLDQTHVLARLIEDLRTLALSDAGVLRLQPEPTDLVALVRDVVAGFEPEAHREGAALAVTTGLAAGDLEIDPLRIRQVLANLLSNAIRHTPAGGAITVSIDAVDGGVAVAVADAGEGIPPEDVPRIFDRFYKGAASRGAGLGLTIARRLVVAHGGEIAASSRPGQGTTVRFVLPRAAGVAVAAASR
jgi:two-component system OmpR family sensor kinase/two-component system sensor histidine kinase BaeS